jgi:hypothetical protein
MLGESSQALLTMLYRSTDCLCRRGAAMKNLAHSASLHAGENNAPSKPGIKHLEAPPAPPLSSQLSRRPSSFRRPMARMATSSCVFTIAQVGKTLGKDAALNEEVASETEPEDGCLRICHVDDEHVVFSITAFELNTSRNSSRSTEIYGHGGPTINVAEVLIVCSWIGGTQFEGEAAK